MRKHRIHTAQPLEPERELQLDGATAHYLQRVLRVAPGQHIVLFNGDGQDYAAEVTRLGRDCVTVDVRSRLPGCAESPLAITVVQAVTRGERMDLTLQKCTELGAAAFRPVFTQRGEVRLQPDKLARRMEHWQKVIVSACEQSGRARLPALHPPLDVMAWAREAAVGDRYLLAPQGRRPLARITPRGAVELLIGPEGGLEAFEQEQLERCGIEPLTLGPRVLRTETAGPAAVAVLQALAGDLA